LQDAQAALGLNPELAEGYFLLANVYEGQGQVPRALEALQRVADLAEKQGNDALVVVAKTRQGYLMQGGGAFAVRPAATP
jgi:hypothetical protein